MRRIASLPLLCCLAHAATAQEATPSFEELQAMIARMQQQVDQLGASSTERDKALQVLGEQVEKAAGQIEGAGQTNDSLRGQAATLNTELQGVSAQRDQLSGEVGNKGVELDRTKDRLAALEAALDGEREGRAAAGQDLDAARGRVAALEGEAGARAGELQAAQAELAQARQRLGTLEADLTTARAAGAERSGAPAELGRLRGENDTLRSMLDAAADAEDRKDRELAELKERLEGTDEGQDLSAARSEFFGRLKDALGERQDLRIVGDRFVFQAELLFASGSATLDPAGLGRLRELAQSLREVASSIPPDIDWVLRVDGHTDRLPVRQGPFASNWDLSAARAISVVEFLVREGIPANRLAATGFGEFRPLDARDDEIAYRRNRRIEFKLTEG